jgi:hypothetical protein
VKTSTDHPVILVQRQTVEWSQLSDAGFHQQSREFCKLWGKPEDYVWQLFRLWNQTFAIDYREVRQQLKNISLQNFRHTQDVDFVPYQNYKNLPQQDGYYIFLDDDDWVDPEIVTHLAAQLTTFASPPPLLLWRSANIGSPQQEFVVFVWGMNGRCMTNNYAVHRAWLQPFSNIHEVLQHKDAGKVFGEGMKIPHLDCALTVSNKSPVSSVSLDRGLNGDLSPARLKALVANYLERMRKVQDSELVYMPWSRPLINETIAVFERVTGKARVNV